MLQYAILALTITLVTGSFLGDWHAYKTKHNKSYTYEEDIVRRYIWKSNLDKIKKHNELYAKGESSFYLAENKFADMVGIHLVLLHLFIIAQFHFVYMYKS